MIQAALGYLRRGWSIIPTAPNKRPIIAWKKFTMRLPTEEEARRWWDVPDPPGLAVVTGRVSGRAVFDVESHGLSHFPDLPRTLKAKTQGGGEHSYYRFPDAGGDSLKHVYSVDGLHVADLKGNGGYVLAPPTVGSKGVYAWIDEADIVPLPAFCFRPSVVPRPFEPVSPSSGAVEVHGVYPSRSHKLAAIARKVVAAGGGEAEVMAACLADVAGSKIVEKGKYAEAYVRTLVQEAHRYLASESRGEVKLAIVVQVTEGVSGKGKRITVKLRLADGRTIRQGVTELESDRWSSFKKALPVAAEGRKVWVELHETEWNGMNLLRVRRWLERP